MKTKIWLVTGASKGLGKTLVEKALSAGDSVIATSRDRAGLVAALGEENSRFLPVSVDLSDAESIRTAVRAAREKFGSIDVLVNNAGYGQFGAVEELSDAEVRGNFEVNVFGLLNMTREVLPLMREQNSGHILNISSIGGMYGEFPGVGIYCATKFAVAGLSEGLASDLAPLGVKVTVVYPGYFRTEFLSSGSVAVPTHPIEEYTAVREVVKQHVNSIDGNQPGDPAKAALAMISVVRSPNPPLHFVLGKDAYGMAETKRARVHAEMSEWEEVATRTDLQ